MAKVKVLEAFGTKLLREKCHKGIDKVAANRRFLTKISILDLNPLRAYLLNLRADLKRFPLEEQDLTVLLISRMEGHTFVL